MAERMARVGQKVIRGYMPEQHRQFYEEQPFLAVGSIDALGRPWASILTGRPGFVKSPDSRALTIDSRPVPGDPLVENAVDGAALGALGLQFHTRRRNRVNGKLDLGRADGKWTLRVDQSFGNCPKYIQARMWRATPELDQLGEPRESVRSQRLDEEMARLISAADTFFIASAFTEGGVAAPQAYGADVSHRGGKPGFARVLNDRELVYPDYSGNFHFNTIGNLEENPWSGYLFWDFETGDTLQLSGQTEVVWEEGDIPFEAGAERMVRFRLDTVILTRRAVPLAWDFLDYSPHLAFERLRPIRRKGG